MQYFMDEGEVDVINKYLQTQDLYIGLFSDPATITEDKVLTDLIELPLEIGGYDRQLLAMGDWTVVGSVASQPYKTFNFLSNQTVRGYFITSLGGSGDGLLLAVVYFTTPLSMLIGEILKVKANIEVL